MRHNTVVGYIHLLRAICASNARRTAAFRKTRAAWQNIGVHLETRVLHTVQGVGT